MLSSYLLNSWKTGAMIGNFSNSNPFLNNQIPFQFLSIFFFFSKRKEIDLKGCKNQLIISKMQYIICLSI